MITVEVKCAHCGQTFLRDRRKRVLKQEKAAFCSVECEVMSGMPTKVIHSSLEMKGASISSMANGIAAWRLRVIGDYLVKLGITGERIAEFHRVVHQGAGTETFIHTATNIVWLTVYPIDYTTGTMKVEASIPVQPA